MNTMKKLAWTAMIILLGLVSLLMMLAVDPESAYWSFALPWAAAVVALLAFTARCTPKSEFGRLGKQ